MYSGVPIIADNSGGPKESVGPGCGYLCKTTEEWAENMWKMMQGEKKTMNKGRNQVINKFSFKKFSSDFVDGIKEVTKPKQA